MISSSSSRRAPAPPLCKDARRFYLANLTFRSRVRPLTLLHERHDALLMSVCPPSRPRLPTSSHHQARRALPGTAKPYLLELELQVARAIPSIAYCMQSKKSVWIRLRFLVGSQKSSSSTSPSDPTRRDRKETSRAEQSRVALRVCHAHAMPRHVFFAQLGTAGRKAAKQQQGEGGGRARRADGLTLMESAAPSPTANFWFVDPSSPGKVFACPTLAHDDGRDHGHDRGNGMGEPVGDGETQGDIVAVKLFRRWRTPTARLAPPFIFCGFGSSTKSHLASFSPLTADLT